MSIRSLLGNWIAQHNQLLWFRSNGQRLERSQVAHPVNLLIAINSHERVAHPAFFWRGGAFSSGTRSDSHKKPRPPPGQNQPGWATHNIGHPVQPNHLTRSYVSRVTDPPLPEHLTCPHALGTRPLSAIQVSPLHHLHLLPAATLPRHTRREECLRALSRTNPSQLSTRRDRLCRDAGTRPPARH